MKQRSRKTIRSLIVALAVAAIAAPVAQAGFQVRSEHSQVARPVSSFYSSAAYRALMARSVAMNNWYRTHSSTSVGSSTVYPDAFSRELTKSQSASLTVRHADDRAGVRGPGITQTPQVVSSSPNGFDWGDASIGAGVALGAAIVLVGGGIALSRRNRTEPVAV
jgi:hypothetical protein